MLLLCSNSSHKMPGRKGVVRLSVERTQKKKRKKWREDCCISCLVLEMIGWLHLEYRVLKHPVNIRILWRRDTPLQVDIIIIIRSSQNCIDLQCNIKHLFVLLLNHLRCKKTHLSNLQPSLSLIQIHLTSLVFTVRFLFIR